MDTSFSSLCTVPALSLSIIEEIITVGLQGEKATAALIDKEEAAAQQRDEKEVSTAASHNLAKNILEIVIFSRHTNFVPLICSTSWQVITILV